MLIKLILIDLGSFEKWVFPAEHDQMFSLLQVLIIKECPKLMGLPFSNHTVSPDWLPKLQELEILNCAEFLSVTPISWIERLRCVTMKRVKLLEEFAYSKSFDGVQLEIIGKGDLHSLHQVLVFDKETGLEKLTLNRCPPLELKHLLMLTSLKRLIVKSSDGLFGALGGQGDVERLLPIEYFNINGLKGDSRGELTELLPHLPKLSKLKIRELDILGCPELVIVDSPTLVSGGGWLLALRSLQRLRIEFPPKFLSNFTFSGHIFPSSLQFLNLVHVEGMGSLEPLSNLSSLTRLELWNCGEDLKCQGLRSLLTTGGQLNILKVFGSPRFFVGWDPNPTQALEDVEGEEPQTQLVSSALRVLQTDDVAGLLAAPICSFLSSSLTELELSGYGSEGMELFGMDQEDALQLLSSLQQLQFSGFHDLQQLPSGLHNLTSLKILSFFDCPAVLSLPNDGIPKSLQELVIYHCCSKELTQQCMGLVGTIPKIIID